MLVYCISCCIVLHLAVCVFLMGGLAVLGLAKTPPVVGVLTLAGMPLLSSGALVFFFFF